MRAAHRLERGITNHETGPRSRRRGVRGGAGRSGRVRATHGRARLGGPQREGSMRSTLAAFGLALLVAGCGRGGREGVWSGTVELPDVEVGSLVGGRVLQVLKQEGEAAAAGETLVALDPAEWQSNLDEARALAETTRKELDLLKAGP